MWPRRQLAAAAAIAASTVGFRTVLGQQPPGTGQGMPNMGSAGMTLQECIDSCLKSHSMCLETGRYCIEKGGMHVAGAHLALLLDCAEMCQTTANSLLRQSSQHAAICIACAQICDACAQSCETFQDDERMRRCATTCRDCASSCRMMSKLPI